MLSLILCNVGEYEVYVTQVRVLFGMHVSFANKKVGECGRNKKTFSCL